jgi:hypothetical protein
MKLSNEQYLLTCLAEEASEVSEEGAKLVKRVTKALRFGLEEIQKGQTETNIERMIGVIGSLVYELNDLIAILELLGYEELDFGQVGENNALEAKKVKVAKYMELSRERGIID